MGRRPLTGPQAPVFPHIAPYTILLDGRRLLCSRTLLPTRSSWLGRRLLTGPKRIDSIAPHVTSYIGKDKVSGWANIGNMALWASGL
jgi:hypothetical protein